MNAAQMRLVFSLSKISPQLGPCPIPQSIRYFVNYLEDAVTLHVRPQTIRIKSGTTALLKSVAERAVKSCGVWVGQGIKRYPAVSAALQLGFGGSDIRQRARANVTQNADFREIGQPGSVSNRVKRSLAPRVLETRTSQSVDFSNRSRRFCRLKARHPGFVLR